MKSLRDLNSFASLTVEFTDDRLATVTFDRPVPTNQTLTSTENNTFVLPVGIEIETIVDYTTTQPYVEFDFTGFAGNVDLVFPTLPAHLSVVESPTNFFTVTGLQTPADWDLIKSPTVQPPFGFTGVETITVNIRWTTADGSTADSETYTVTSTIIDTIYITAGTDFTWLIGTTATITGTPTIVADLGITNPIFTLVMTPSEIDQIINISSSGSSLSSSGASVVNRYFDPITKTYTIQGFKEDLNLDLANLTIEFASTSNPNFIINYELSNNLNSIVESQKQRFFNYQLLATLTNIIEADLEVIWLNLSAIDLYSTITTSAEATKISPYVRFNNYTPNSFSTGVNENQTYTTANTVNITSFTNSSLANIRIIYDLTTCSSGTVLNFASLPPGVTTTVSGRIYTVSGIDTIEEYNAVKNATIIFPLNDVNTQVFTIKILYDDPLGNNKQIDFTTTVYIKPFITNRTVVRSYRRNQGNYIFGNSTPVINNTGDFSTSHRLIFEVNHGNLEYNNTLYSTLTLINIPATLNTIIPYIRYFPLINATTSPVNLTITLEVLSEGSYIQKLNYTTTINYAGNGYLAPIEFIYNQPGTFVCNPPFEYAYYGKFDCNIIAGGGGSSGMITYPGNPAQGLTAAAGGGAGQIRTLLEQPLNNEPLTVIVGRGGSDRQKGGDSSISNSVVSLVSEGGYPGLIHNPARTAVYFNPGSTVRMEGGQTKKNDNTGYFRGDYILGGSGYDYPIGGAGAGGNSWVGLRRSQNPGGPGINILGTVFGIGGNGNWSTAFGQVSPASSNTYGSGGGASGNSVSGTVAGKSGYVRIVLRG